MQSATNVLHVLDEVARRQPVGVTEVARSLEMSKSATQRALLALESAGWIRRTTTARTGWVLTTKAIDVAQRVAADLGVREAARTVLTELRDDTGESTHLAIRESREVVIVDVVETLNPTRIHIPVGTRSPLHATATGKAILAHLDEDQRDAIIGARLTRYTPRTVTDPQQLGKELDAIREDAGPVVVRGELREDIASVAAPVLSRSRVPLCAISVMIPLYRFPEDGGVDLGSRVRAAAECVAGAL